MKTLAYITVTSKGEYIIRQITTAEILARKSTMQDAKRVAKSRKYTLIGISGMLDEYE